MRTVQLGAAKGLTCAVEYRLLLSQGKVVKANPTDGAAPAKKVNQIADETDRIRHAELGTLWPKSADPSLQPNLVRKGVLNCHAQICELILVP